MENVVSRNMNPNEATINGRSEDVTGNRNEAFVSRLRAIFCVHHLSVIAGVLIAMIEVLLYN